MYMSYCRFEGTYHELRACVADVEEHVNEEAEYEVSDNEINFFRLMISDMVEFLQNQELLDEHGELNEEELDKICEAMAKSYESEEYEDY